MRLLLVFLLACGGDVVRSGPDGSIDGAVDATDPVLPPQLARGVRLERLTLFQAVGCDWLRDGALVADCDVPIVAGRDSLLRAEVVAEAPSSVVLVAHLGDTPLAGAPTTVTTTIDRATGLELVIPAALLTAGRTIRVELRALDGDPLETDSLARFPRTGAHDLGLVENGGLDVRFVPVVLDGRTPDLSLDLAHEGVAARFPLADTQLRTELAPPVAWDGPVERDGGGLEPLLEAIQRLRADDDAAEETYYVALVQPADTRDDFCRGGCITGLSPVAPEGTPSLRAAVVVWFPDELAVETVAHELAHTMGLGHAPCGASEDLDPDYPFGDGRTGSWGWDRRTDVLHGPETRDLMGYCTPAWIGAYHLRKLQARITAVTGPRPL